MIAYEARMRADADRRYREELLLWATLAPHLKRRTQPPTKPSILNE